MTTEAILFILVIVVLFILAVFVVPQWRMRRAVRQVIEVFRRYGATHSSTAKTPEELGFRQESGGLLFRRRDYKIHAIDFLIRTQVIQQLEDGRLYLFEEKLLGVKL